MRKKVKSNRRARNAACKKAIFKKVNVCKMQAKEMRSIT